MGKLFIEDTSNFYAIDSGDIVHVNGQDYKVIGHAEVQRFGIEDPKFWYNFVHFISSTVLS